MKNFSFYLIWLFFLTSCTGNTDFTIEDFHPFVNYATSNDTLYLQTSNEDAIIKGISFPSKRDGDPFFKFTFTIRNQSSTSQKYFYKIFYQNETYKFPEFSEKGYNLRAQENFYGSWKNLDIGFRELGNSILPDKSFTVTDSFRIVGNPRDEKIFYGSKKVNDYVKEGELEKEIKKIKNNKDWYDQVVEKAKDNSLSVEEQLYRDALWLVRYSRKQDGKILNNRWKRNPRMGTYSFMLVVVPENELINIPEYIENIGKKDSVNNAFINPFYYFKSKQTKGKNIFISRSKHFLNVKTILNSENGVYVDRLIFDPKKLEKSTFNNECGFSEKLFRNAYFEEFLPAINYDYQLNNVPVAEDVVDANYSIKEYKTNSQIPDSLRIKKFVNTSDKVCEAVNYDAKEQALVIKNIGYKRDALYQKMNVGINSRIGFNYGKFCAKIRFPEILSREHVWNGLTCAFWLKYQDDQKWNYRTNCDGGYIPKQSLEGEKERISETNYSEIDIEIVKAAKHWPETSYPAGQQPPENRDSINENVIVACTNWDLACRDVDKFVKGVYDFRYQGKNMTAHRWSDFYKAITIKTENPHSKTVGGEYFYEIEWKPNEIIWRIGKDKNNMEVIGYMNSEMTDIPNNQMVPVITQEFHDASWWPTAPFSQNNIPFPLNDIKGYVYDITIE